MHILMKTGNFAAPRFHPSLFRRRTGMWLIMADEIYELKKYIQPHREYIWVFIILLVCTLPVPHSKYNGYVVFILAIGFALAGIPLIIEYIMYIMALKKYKSSGLLLDAAVDFRSSVSFIKGNITLGTKYLFRKNSSRIISYEEIIYLSLANDTPSNQIFRAKLSNGKTISLYKISGIEHSRYKDDFLTMIRNILDRNTAIHIDYRLMGLDKSIEQKVISNQSVVLSHLSAKDVLSNQEGKKKEKKKKKKQKKTSKQHKEK